MLSRARYRAEGLVLALVALLAGFTCPAAAEPPTAQKEFPIIQANHGITLHKEMYVLPFTYSDKYRSRETEIIFKLSAKQDVFGSRFFVAYSQISFWQAYDSGNSAPFRDTNYNPEIFYCEVTTGWSWVYVKSVSCACSNLVILDLSVARLLNE